MEDDLVKACNDAGKLFSSFRTGSHHKVKHPAAPSILVVPAHRPIKPVYIRALVRFIDAVREAQG